MRSLETGRAVLHGKNAIHAKRLGNAFELSKTKILKIKSPRCEFVA